MQGNLTSALMGFYFFPRGGSAHAARAIADELDRDGVDLTVVAGSRSDLGEDASARSFFDRTQLATVDFSRALRSADPCGFEARDAAPLHASYEDREGAADRVLASLDDGAYETQVAAWIRELTRAGAGYADLLYLHHLTPINEAARRAFPEIPVIGHIHGSELLMLERIADGRAPASWAYADAWAERLCDWAARCGSIVVNSPRGLERAVVLLDLDPDRFELIPNGFAPSFHPMEVDRPSHWRRHLADSPRGWRPGEETGSVGYEAGELAALEGTVLLYSGRFTEVKRLTLLIEAFAEARERFSSQAALVLLGGYPGEWEGEHPLETIERIGVPDVFLAGWHSHRDLPRFLNASDVLVHASVREQFGLVLVEAMACGLAPIAVDRGGPATIVDDGITGWLVPPDDRAAMADAMVEAVNDPRGRAVRAQRARRAVNERYTWKQVGEQISALVDRVMSEGAEVPAERAGDPLALRRS